MSCHGCATKFGLWTKENGCPSCGFSFCSSCLKLKCAVPKHDNKICKVCKNCFDSLSSSSKNSAGMSAVSSRAPPDIFLKRLEALDSPPKPPVTVYRAAEPRLRKLMKGLSSTDLDIARRLEKLREDRRAAKSVPTEEEIARRLAVLKGQDAEDIKKPSYGHVVPDTRSGEEQTRDLLSQYKVEVDLDGKQTKPEDEIADRLNRLRNGDLGEPQMSASKTGGKYEESITLDEIAQLLAQCKMEAAESGKQPDLATIATLEKLRNRLVQPNKDMDEDCSSDDDEKAASKILSQVQAEVELEKKMGLGKVCDEEEEIMDTDNDQLDELPWCIICNEDAKIRCLGCDRDLFCNTCFQEGHTDDEMKSHSFEPFKLK